jgi:hypothetical protein
MKKCLHKRRTRTKSKKQKGWQTNNKLQSLDNKKINHLMIQEIKMHGLLTLVYTTHDLLVWLVPTLQIYIRAMWDCQGNRWN